MLWCKTVQIPRRSIMLMTEEKTKKIRERWKTEGLYPFVLATV